MPVPASQTQTTSEIQSTRVPGFDLGRQYLTIRHEIHEAVERVLSSQHFIGGPELQSFETEAAVYLDVAAAIACASGTDALWLALAACGVQSGDAVITSPFSFFASASSITRCGATPVFADIDAGTLNLSPESVEAVLKGRKSHRVKAVLPVHLFGQCVDIAGFDRLSGEFGVAMVEDAAQAFGAKWGNRHAGAFGKAAAFSFYPTKNLGAYGDGGCVTTDDPAVAEHARRLRNHGSERRYFHEELGWNSRLDALQATVLRVKLHHLDEWNEQRRSIAAAYGQLFRDAGLLGSNPTARTPDAPVALLPVLPEAFHIYHQYVVRTLRRDELRAFLTSNWIGTEIYYPLPLHLQEAFAYLGYSRGDFPEAERAAAEVIALPMFPELRQDEQERVVAAIAEFYS
jgi:dTDP-4-amino-4,6-dideoxygalactose transaminase